MSAYGFMHWHWAHVVVTGTCSILPSFIGNQALIAMAKDRHSGDGALGSHMCACLLKGLSVAVMVQSVAVQVQLCLLCTCLSCQ